MRCTCAMCCCAIASWPSTPCASLACSSKLQYKGVCSCSAHAEAARLSTNSFMAWDLQISNYLLLHLHLAMSDIVCVCKHGLSAQLLEPCYHVPCTLVGRLLFIVHLNNICGCDVNVLKHFTVPATGVTCLSAHAALWKVAHAVACTINHSLAVVAAATNLLYTTYMSCGIFLCRG